MKGLDIMYLSPDKYNNRKFDHAIFAGRKKNVRIGKGVIWEVIWFGELEITLETAHEILMSTHS